MFHLSFESLVFVCDQNMSYENFLELCHEDDSELEDFYGDYDIQYIESSEEDFFYSDEPDSDVKSFSSQEAESTDSQCKSLNNLHQPLDHSKIISRGLSELNFVWQYFCKIIASVFYFCRDFRGCPKGQSYDFASA